MRVCITTCICCLLSIFSFANDGKTVLLSILARNKAHVLPKFLQCIEDLHYDKHLISVYINTNNNEDTTEEVLQEWSSKHKKAYKSIIFEKHHVPHLGNNEPHEWTPERFSVLGKIRNTSLQKAKELKTDYYFVVDCDNFITPETLQTLVSKDKSIIAPLLKAVPITDDVYSNFFCDISDNGYYKDHPQYSQILQKTIQGTFSVPVVHCTYLIDTQHLDKLTYVDGTEDYEFVIFSRSARNAQIEQYICNEQDFGTLIHMPDGTTLEQEREMAINILKITPQ